MRKRRNEVPQAETKILDVNASMQGTLRFDDPVNLRISGKFEGTLDTKGELMVGREAEIKANITGESVSIAGNVNGNIKATRMLRLDGSARLNGDVETPKLAIDEGAILNGRLRMSSAAGGNTSKEDWMTTKQLAKYLEVDSNKISEWVTKGMIPGSKEGGAFVFERAKIDKWISEGKVKG